MCRKCDAQRQFLIDIEDAAVYCAHQHGTIAPLVTALVCEETDQEVAKHLTFLCLDLESDGQAVEDTLIGRVYLNVLEIKARLQ
jgi:hypothetical protein